MDSFDLLAYKNVLIVSTIKYDAIRFNIYKWKRVKYRTMFYNKKNYYYHNHFKNT